MSDNSVKLYVEDLLFQFREGVPGYRFDAAMLRLIETRLKKMRCPGQAAGQHRGRRTQGAAEETTCSSCVL